MQTLYLTNKLRNHLKIPIGTPVTGKEHAVKQQFQDILKTTAHKKLITVGDITSKLFDADIKIFDGRILRNTPVPTPTATLTAKNPQAAIDKDIWNTLKQALASPKKEKILIYGEEDLLVLPLIILSEPGTIIAYGLPHEGISYVIPDKKTKTEAESILNQMRTQKFKKIVIGGTFDHLHDGHKHLLKMSKYYAKTTLIGLTSEAMTKQKPHPDKIQPYEKRKKNIEDYAKKINLNCDITEINNIYGPAIDNTLNLDAIILTEETLKNGIEINKKRKENNMEELEYIIHPYILGADKTKIDSTSLRTNQ